MMVLSLFLSACDKNDQKPHPEGVQDASIYLMDSVMQPEDDTLITNMKRNSNGEYLISFLKKVDHPSVGERMETLGVYSEDFALLRMVEDDFASLDQQWARISAFALDNQGHIYVVLMEKGNALAGRQLMQYDKDGALLSQTMLDAPEHVWDGRVLDDLYVTDERIILVSSVGIQILDRNGKTITELYGQDKSPFYITSANVDDAGYLYYAYSDSQTSIPYLRKISLLDGQEAWSNKFNFGNKVRNITINLPDGKIYVQNENKIDSFDSEGNYIQTLLDLRAYNGVTVTETDSSYYTFINDLVVVNETEILYTFSNFTSGSEIIRLLEPEEDLKQQMLVEKQQGDANKTRIRLFLPYNDRIITDILYDFGLATNTEVMVEYYSDSFMNFNVADYLQKVSARLLSGDPGWDIMSTTYARKGYFADLYTTAKADELRNDSLYYTNILKASELNGGLYVYPFSVSFLALSSHSVHASPSFATLDDLYEAGASISHSGETAFKLSRDMNVSLLFMQTLSSWYRTEQGTVEFDESKFIETLTTLARFYDNELYGESYNEGIYSISRESMFNPGIAVPAAGIQLLPGGADGNSFGMLGYAIMKNSDVIEQSLDLLTYLSEHESMKFGILRAGVLERLDQIEAAIKARSQFSPNPAPDVSAYRKNILAIYDSFDRLNDYDINIYGLAHKQTFLCLEGKTTAQSAADTIRNAIWLLNKEDGA